MKHLLLSLLIFGFGISGSLGQTIKSLGYNTTNGQVVANTGTNVLTFVAPINLSANNVNAVSFVLADEDLTAGYGGPIGSLGFGGAKTWVKYGSNQTDWGQLVYLDGNGYSGLRTNLGLGGGITTNRTFVSYNGTNYTTNTVTISNGIITGWTQ